MKITLENNETHDLDMTIDEVKKRLDIEVEFPQLGDVYWYVDDCGYDRYSTWDNGDVDNYRLAHGNCSPTPKGLDAYKADMAKLAAIVAIRKHRDKTFGVFEPAGGVSRYYAIGDSSCTGYLVQMLGITVPFATKADIERSFVECAEAWEVLR